MGVYFPDDDFVPDIPKDDDPLWRYIDFTQFISLMENRSLWFAAAAQFTDEWEGGLTSKQVDRIAQNIPSFIDNEKESVKQLFDALRATTYVSSWHQRSNETSAMWELYNDRGKEVAIKTTIGGLRSSLRWSEDMMMGCVEYKNYRDELDLFPVTRESPFFHKRISYDHESEFRVVKSELNFPANIPIQEGLKDVVSEMGGAGRRVRVNRVNLIDEVVISPVAGEWLKDLVESVLRTHEIADEIDVRYSQLSETPFSSD